MHGEASVGGGQELAEALAHLDQAGAALTRARTATEAARRHLEDRRAEEAQALSAYEQAAAGRSRVSAQERIEALQQVGGGEGDDLAYEADWYRRLLQGGGEDDGR